MLHTFLYLFVACLFANPSYNEVFDDNGKKRLPYFILDQIGFPANFNNQKLSHKMKDSPLRDKLKIHPIPLVMEEKEYIDIISDINVRMVDLVSIFYTYVFLNHSYSEDYINILFNLEGWSLEKLRALWRGQPKEKLRAFFGPDLYRMHDGRWAVLEDNIGNVGGRGDVKAIFDSMTSASDWPSYFIRPDFIEASVAFFLESIGLSLDDPKDIEKTVAIWQYDTEKTDIDDKEDLRIYEELKQLGIRVIKPSRNTDLIRDIIANEGTKAILNFSDPTFNKELNYDFYYHILQETNIELMVAPGIEVIDNKAFTHMVYDMKKKGKVAIDIESYDLVTEIPEKIKLKPSDYVFKASNGVQGEQVLFFNDASEEVNRKNLENFFYKNSFQDNGNHYFFYIAQKLISPSTIPGDKYNPEVAIDLRPLGYFYGNGSTVYSSPWARAAELKKNVKTNINQGASELVVLLLADEAAKPFRCQYLFH